MKKHLGKLFLFTTALLCLFWVTVNLPATSIKANARLGENDEYDPYTPSQFDIGESFNGEIRIIAGARELPQYDFDKIKKIVFCSSGQTPPPTASITRRIYDDTTINYDPSTFTIYVYTPRCRFECDSDSSCMFKNLAALEEIDFGDKFDTSGVRTMAAMFLGCKKLTHLDISCFDTGAVYNMVSMFDECSSLTSINWGTFDTSNVEYMDGMFYRCSAFKSLNLSSFNTSKLFFLAEMFYGCNSLESLDLSNFDLTRSNAPGGDTLTTLSIMNDNLKYICSPRNMREDIICSKYSIYGATDYPYDLALDDNADGIPDSSARFGNRIPASNVSHRYMVLHVQPKEEKPTPQQPEPQKPEPKQPEPQKPEPQKPEPQKSETQKPEQQKSESQKSESQKSDSQKSDTRKEKTPQESVSQNNKTQSNTPKEKDTSAGTKNPQKPITINGITYKIDARGKATAIRITSKKKASINKITVNRKAYPVVAIADNACKNNKSIKAVTIGSNVTSIGKKAFYKCKNLKKVTINANKSLKIGKHAFTKINKKANVKIIGVKGKTKKNLRKALKK